VLNFIERHKIGILTTIIFHLLLITGFLVMQFGTLTQKKESKQVFIDFSDPDELQKQIEQKKEEIKALSQKEFLKNMQQEYLGHNLPVNEANHDANKSIDKMVTDIKQELNIKENDQRQVVEKETPVEKKEAKIPQQKSEYTTNSKGERTFYKGATTVSYFLEGRMHTYFPVPVYQCQGSGKVYMNIDVDQRGYVIQANIDKAKSQITDECLIEAAKRAALTAHFNEKSNAPEKQSGYIVYIFIAQ
jgi:hypothetical protein